MDIIVDEFNVKTDDDDNGENNEILTYVNKLISDAEKRGDEYIIITAKRVHDDLNLRGNYPEVCEAMRLAQRRGDVILKEVSPSDYSTLEIKYVLRTVKKTTNAAPRTPLDIIDAYANKALHYADVTFTVLRYMLCVVFGIALVLVGVNIVNPANFPIAVWGGREIWFMILTVMGGILFLSSEISTFIYLASIPKSTGAWLKSYASKVRYAFSFCMVGVVVSTVCLIAVDGGRVASCSLLIAFAIMAATFIAQAMLCGLRSNK